MKPTVIGIAGGTGSGKTFLTKKILEMSVTKDIVVIEQDAYYKDLSHMPYEKRVKQNFDHPDSIDLDLFESQLLQLIKGEAINIPIYDFSKHIRTNKTKKMTTTNITTPKPTSRRYSLSIVFFTNGLIFGNRISVIMYASNHFAIESMLKIKPFL